jgi:hypothetical protein
VATGIGRALTGRSAATALAAQNSMPKPMIDLARARMHFESSCKLQATALDQLLSVVCAPQSLAKADAPLHSRGLAPDLCFQSQTIEASDLVVQLSPLATMMQIDLLRGVDGRIELAIHPGKLLLFCPTGQTALVFA